MRTKKCFFRFVTQDGDAAKSPREVTTTDREGSRRRPNSTLESDVSGPAPLVGIRMVPRPLCDHGSACNFAHWDGELLPQVRNASSIAGLESETGAEARGAPSEPSQVEAAAWIMVCEAY